MSEKKNSKKMPTMWIDHLQHQKCDSNFNLVNLTLKVSALKQNLVKWITMIKIKKMRITANDTLDRSSSGIRGRSKNQKRIFVTTKKKDQNVIDDSKTRIQITMMMEEKKIKIRNQLLQGTLNELMMIDLIGSFQEWRMVYALREKL